MIIGLTGSIGSGKSYVAKCFGNHGAVIISADQLAREAISPQSPGFQKVLEIFGQEILNSNGEIDRQSLASIVFSDPKQKIKLESIIHPIVRQREEELIQQHKTHAEFIVLDIPLLFETNAENLCDKVVVVRLDDDIRMTRLMENRSMSAEEVQKRLASQMSQDEKVRRADFVIDNSGSMEQSAQQVSDLITKLKIIT